jgi:hypothetical protein
MKRRRMAEADPQGYALRRREQNRVNQRALRARRKATATSESTSIISEPESSSPVLENGRTSSSDDSQVPESRIQSDSSVGFVLGDEVSSSSSIWPASPDFNAYDISLPVESEKVRSHTCSDETNVPALNQVLTPASPEQLEEWRAINITVAEFIRISLS